MSSIEPTTSYRKVKAGSDRNFGLTFAAVFALIAFAPMISGRPARLWAVGIALAFAAAALLAPLALKSLNRLWMRLGLLLHHVVNPVIMALLFFGAVVPTGWVVRLRGGDLLRLKRDSSAETYWIKRDPPGPAPTSMSKQF